MLFSLLPPSLENTTVFQHMATNDLLKLNKKSDSRKWESLLIIILKHQVSP